MDGDAFFVGVEVARNPKLKGMPVVTGEERGIVSALSYEAKALGVTRGLPIFKLKKQFPQVIILPGDYASYARYSSMMFDIVRRYADDVEEYSIDECFADLTGLERPLKMSYEEIGRKIKKEINEEMGLSVSLGLAPTKVLAKVASKWKKPNGFTIITHETAGEFIQKVSVHDVWGIGRKTSEYLNKKGIRTAGEFAEKPLWWIQENLSRPYKVLWEELRGVSVMDVDPRAKTEYSSMQRTRTFHPFTNDPDFLISQLSKHIEDVCAKARHYHLVPRRISFFLKTREFGYHSLSLSLQSPTNAPEMLISLIIDHFKDVHRKGVKYRTAGVTLSELVPTSVAQADLFGGSVKAGKFEAIHQRIDDLERKFGKKVVHLASTHKALKREVKGTDADDFDRNLVFL
jgi:DNA polymerase-4/DNA polymerase V